MTWSDIITIIVPIVASQIVVQIVSHWKQSTDIDKRLSLMEYKVDTLSERVDKHNNLDSRVTKLESIMEVR